MDPTITWAAGLFDGEGHMRSSQLRLRMTDLDLVQRFQQTFGVGNIVPTKIYGNRQQAWEWSIGKKSEVRRILSALLPYFGNRRAYKALNILDNLET